MLGDTAAEFTKEARAICESMGLEYMLSNVCGARFARGVHSIIYNREDAEETARADACYRKLAEFYASRGVFVGRAPTLYQPFHHGHRTPEVNEATSAIKRALDPNGVIAPGKYGITT